MKLTILITKNILKQSKNCLMMPGQNCAIGKAIYALFGARSSVGTDLINIYSEGIFTLEDTYRKKVLYTIPLPQIAQDFIDEFDNLGPYARVQMTPIAFDINIPEELVSSLGLDYIHNVVNEQPQLAL